MRVAFSINFDFAEFDQSRSHISMKAEPLFYAIRKKNKGRLSEIKMRINGEPLL
jgi:hypothetical protein